MTLQRTEIELQFGIVRIIVIGVFDETTGQVPLDTTIKDFDVIPSVRDQLIAIHSQFATSFSFGFKSFQLCIRPLWTN